MLELLHIEIENDGKRLRYATRCDAAVSRFFKPDALFVEYEENVAGVPQSILAIPFLANVMPIAWFGGFDVSVDEVDADFLASLGEIRSEWEKHYAQLGAVKSELRYNKSVQNNIPAQKNAMLFSGGVDAFATYFRHFEETPDLVTIQGADIGLKDRGQWNEVRAFNDNEPILGQNRKHYLSTNFRDFYTFNVDLLLESRAWWGNIQHGLALLGIVAPLSYKHGFGRLYIASTRSAHMEFNPWGSMPEIDDKIAWAGMRAVHDGFELKRQDKVRTIVEKLKSLHATTSVRVCYSEIRTTLNCSRCEKCVRTIFGIILAGGNPNDSGFAADASVYERIRKILAQGFKSRGTQFFWKELYDEAAGNDNFYVFSDKATEKQAIASILEILRENEGAALSVPSQAKRFKEQLIHKYPRLFNLYMKVRRAI